MVQTVHPGESGLESWKGAGLRVFSDVNTQGDTAQSTLLLEHCSFHCFQNALQQLENKHFTPCPFDLFPPSKLYV